MVDKSGKSSKPIVGEENIVNTSGGNFIKSFNLQTKAKALIEEISNITKTYLSTDLDHFTMDQITSTIVQLEEIIYQWDTDDDVSVVIGLVSSCVASLYVARGLATPNIPRDLLYYQNMQETRRLLRQLRNISA